MIFEPIIQYFIEKGELHERAVRNTRLFAAYLENQTDYTKARLKEVIQRYNYETILPKTEGNKSYLPLISFFRGVDDFETVAAIDYDGGIGFLDDIVIVKGQYDRENEYSDEEKIAERKTQTSVKINLTKFPISQLGYYEYKGIGGLYYAWLAYLWQEVEGHQCGLKVMTLQNNSCSCFSLNDFLQDNFSAFMGCDRGIKPPRIDNFFPRKLSIVELLLRASQLGYPFNPYKNYWRYFEKDDEFIEIVTYECATGVRSGKISERLTAEVQQIIQHEKPKSALMHLTEFTNQAIFNGWEEKLRPLGLPAMMNKSAYDFEFWTGINWFEGDEQKNRLKKEDIMRFEKHHGIELPDAFFQYLRLFNGRQYNNYHLYFPINDLYTVKVEKFYTLDELNKSASSTLAKNPNYLWIGNLEANSRLGICIKKGHQNYGKIIIERRENSGICDYTFEKFACYAQGSPTQPEIFAAQENDVPFLKKRIEEGWDFNTNYTYQTAVSQAAEHNAYEALELLLQNGARLEHKNHRDVPWLYDKKTMKILDKYS